MQSPNILFLMCDQLRADALSPDSVCLTPHLDGLARRGVRFCRAYTPNPVCSPARASLMTGLLPHNHGVTVVTHTVDDDQACLRTDKPHWAQQFVHAGYSTGYFGKWHIERANDLARYGWQTNGSYESLGMQTAIRQRVQTGPYRLAGYNTAPPGYRADSLLYGVTEAPVENRMMTVAVDAAAEFLENATAGPTPWCCFVSLTEPHDPFVCGEEAYEQYDVDTLPLPVSADDDLRGRPNVYRLAADVWRGLSERERREAAACYYGSVTEIDSQFGRLLQLLEANGQLGNTLVILTSDHGEFLGAHGLYCKNFHAGEEVYQVPLLMAGPGVAAEQVCPARVGTHDLASTLLEYVGLVALEVPDSQSFFPLLANPEVGSERERGYAEYSGGRMLLTQRVVWDGPWKFVFNGFDYSELYNLDDDPHELHNRVLDSDAQEVVKHMCRIMWETARRTGDHSLFNSQYPILRVAPYGPEI